MYHDDIPMTSDADTRWKPDGRARVRTYAPPSKRIVAVKVSAERFSERFEKRSPRDRGAQSPQLHAPPRRPRTNFAGSETTA